MATGTTAYSDPETENVIERKAGGAIGAGEVVMLDSTEGQVVVTTGNTSIAIGVAKNTVGSGEKVKIQTAGLAKVKVSAGIALGAEVMPGANGKIATASGAVRVMGVAESLTDTDGQFARVRLALPAVKQLAQS